MHCAQSRSSRNHVGDGVDQHHLGLGSTQQRSSIQRFDPHPVRQQIECREHAPNGSVGAAGGEQSYLCHAAQDSGLPSLCLEGPPECPAMRACRGNNAVVSETEAMSETSSVSVTLMVCAAAALLGLTALAGETSLALALGVAVIVIGWGWAGTLGLPTPRGTVGVLLLGGVAILLSVYLPENSDQLTWLPGALAVAIISAFFHQLLRRDGRPRVAESVSSVLLALAIFTCGSFLIPLARTVEGGYVVVAAVAAAAASASVEMLLRGRGEGLRQWLMPLTLLAGGAAAAVVTMWSLTPWTSLVVIGVGSAAVSFAIRLICSVMPTMAHARPRLVVALSSVLAIGIIPYAVSLAIIPAALPR